MTTVTSNLFTKDKLAEIELALELYQLTERQREDKKRSDVIKEYFKNQYDEGQVQLGSLLLAITPATRENTNLKLLRADLGESILAKYVSTTYYKKLSIKKVA